MRQGIKEVDKSRPRTGRVVAKKTTTRTRNAQQQGKVGLEMARERYGDAPGNAGIRSGQEAVERQAALMRIRADLQVGPEVRGVQ